MKIIVVEDEPEQMEVIRYCIQAVLPNAQVIETSDGLELLNQLENYPTKLMLPDLIILDLNMPGMDGRLTLQKLKANPNYSALRVALFTSSIVQMDRMFGKLYKTPLFSKSLNLSECKEAIQKILNHFGMAAAIQVY